MTRYRQRTPREEEQDASGKFMKRERKKRSALSQYDCHKSYQIGDIRDNRPGFYLRVTLPSPGPRRLKCPGLPSGIAVLGHVKFTQWNVRTRPVKKRFSPSRRSRILLGISQDDFTLRRGRRCCPLGSHRASLVLTVYVTELQPERVAECKGQGKGNLPSIILHGLTVSRQ